MSRNAKFLRLCPVYEVKTLNQMYTEGNSAFVQVLIQFVQAFISEIKVEHGGEPLSSQVSVD